MIVEVEKSDVERDRVDSCREIMTYLHIREKTKLHGDFSFEVDKICRFCCRKYLELS